jgi:hypothetical protein
MPKIHKLILAATLLFAPPALAAIDDCAPYSAIPVHVEPVWDEPQLDNATPLAELQSLGRDTARSIPHYEAVLLGMTRYEPTLEFSAPILQQPMPDGSFCARAQRLDVKFGYRDIKVYVAREFPQGSCDFQHVMTHEQKHVEVNRRLLQEFAPKIEAQLSSFMQLYGMFIVPNESYANTLLRDKVNAIFKDITQQLIAENRRRQRLIDSPEEYDKSKTACKGHVAEVARRYYFSESKR